MTHELNFDGICIRELSEADTDAFLVLKEIGLATDPDSFVASIVDDSPLYPELIKTRLANASIQNGDVVLGVFSPNLNGIIAVTRDDRIKRRHKADLHGMYIVPDYRGRGIGKVLLVEALEMARQMVGLEEVQLIVAVHNSAAVRLYERFGFEHVWTERHALKSGEHYVDAHHMILDIKSAGKNKSSCRVAINA